MDRRFSDHCRFVYFVAFEDLIISHQTIRLYYIKPIVFCLITLMVFS